MLFSEGWLSLLYIMKQYKSQTKYIDILIFFWNSIWKEVPTTLGKKVLWKDKSKNHKNWKQKQTEGESESKNWKEYSLLNLRSQSNFSSKIMIKT